MHGCGVIHNYIHPKKILTGNNLKSTGLFLINFKNTKKIDKLFGLTGYSEDLAADKGLKLHKFSSLNNHLGISNFPFLLVGKNFCSRVKKR